MLITFHGRVTRCFCGKNPGDFKFKSEIFVLNYIFKDKNLKNLGENLVFKNLTLVCPTLFYGGWPDVFGFFSQIHAIANYELKNFEFFNLRTNIKKTL